MIHKKAAAQEGAQSEETKSGLPATQSETSEAKKAAMARKKAALLAKMKKKQSTFIQAPATLAGAAKSEDAAKSGSTQNNNPGSGTT